MTMPGMIKSKAQQAFLAIHKPKVLKELSGGKVAKGLPNHVSGATKMPSRPMAAMFGGGR